MAKSLDEVIASSLTASRVTIETLVDVIGRAETAKSEAIEEQARAFADSLDLSLNQSDRDEAAERASRCDRNARAYAETIEKLQGKLADKRASDNRVAAETERVAALAERDELAERFRVDVLDASERMIAVLEAVRANTARLEAARLGGEQNAEALARGVPRHFAQGPSPIDQFVKMRIPARSGPGRQWPVDRARAQAMREAAERADLHERTLVEARKPENLAKREAEEAGRYGVYRLSKPMGGSRAPFEYVPRGQSRPKTISLWNEPYEVEISHADADRARQMGLIVEAVEQVAA